MNNKIVVILEDENNIANMLQIIAKKYDFTPICFMYVDDLIEQIELLRKACLFITDYNLCDATVIPILQEMKNRNIDVYTVLNSGNQNAIKDIEDTGVFECINEQIDKTSDFNEFFKTFSQN